MDLDKFDEWYRTDKVTNDYTEVINKVKEINGENNEENINKPKKRLIKNKSKKSKKNINSKYGFLKMKL